jgi:choline kinase
MKNALILCAGSARRFFAASEITNSAASEITNSAASETTNSAASENQPKCLLPLGENVTILDALIRALQARNYNIILGTGCGHEAVATHAREYSGVRCIFNPEYATTNSIVTLWQLRDFVGDETLIVNGDSVIGEEAFDCFTDETTPQMLVKHFSDFDDDTYRVVYDENFSVVRMGKEIADAPSQNCAAFVGISRVGNGEFFLREIEKLISGGTRDTWPTTAYKNLLGTIPVRARDIGSTPSFDVDTPEEYELAKKSALVSSQSVAQ